MTVTNLQPDAEHAIKSFRQEMKRHEVNGVRDLSAGTQDAALQITRHIHALALYMSAALPEREETNYNAGERRTDHLNPQIVSGAWEAVAYLAALANFFVAPESLR